MLNNALKQSVRIAGQQRQVSTTFLTARKNFVTRETFTKSWLSDASTYPLLVCLGGAGVLVVAVGVSCLSFSPDVRIDPKKRNATMRTWGLPGYKA
mmetsp:Transcript_14274/g.33000  ORF Transcript_14274/g.33000 Transcript_14274/m.33000 type:complete len:96 (+) Transcript_14274:151-438(+)